MIVSEVAMKIAVVGSGAIGTLVGVALFEKNQELTDLQVILVGRKSLLQDVEKNGNQIGAKTIHGSLVQTQVDGTRLKVTEDLKEVAQADVVLVCVKSGQTEEVCTELEQIFQEKGAGPKTLVSLQNGVSNPKTMRRILDEKHHVCAGMVGFNVVWKDKAQFIMATNGEIYMQNGPGIEGLAKMMRKGGLDIIVREDITAVQYGKLLVNMNNAVNGLAGVPVVAMMKDKYYRMVLAASIREAMGILNKAGIPIESPHVPVKQLPTLLTIPDCLFKLLLPVIVKIDAEAKSSLLQDLEKHRRTEIEFLNGEIIRLAQEHNMEAPINAHLVHMIHAAEDLDNGPPCIDGRTLASKCGLIK